MCNFMPYRCSTFRPVFLLSTHSTACFLFHVHHFAVLIVSDLKASSVGARRTAYDECLSSMVWLLPPPCPRLTTPGNILGSWLKLWASNAHGASLDEGGLAGEPTTSSRKTALVLDASNSDFSPPATTEAFPSPPLGCSRGAPC